MTDTQNATIKSTMLGYEDHGLFTCQITVDYGGSCQAFGGWTIKGTASIWITKILEVAGAETWEELIGKPIRVKHTRQQISAIGPYLHDADDDESWFNPSDTFNTTDA